MSFVIIIGPAYPLRGGLASFDERLAREFQAQGWETEIFTFSLQYPSFLFPGTSQYSDESPPNDLTIHAEINSINPMNWFTVGRKIKKLKPDLVIVRYWLPFMGPCLGTILRILKKNKHSKVICIADNIIPHEKRIGDRIFTKYFLSTPDAFINMSEKVNEDLKSLKPAALAVIVDHPLYDNFGDIIPKNEARNKLNLDKNEPLILFFGFIRKYKGLNLLIRALANQKLKSTNIKCLIAGEFYEDAEPYLHLIRDLQLENSIYLHTHFISDSEVKYYLSAADVVIQPYVNATQSGVTPLAYHFEKPMIVTNVGALPRLVPHGKVGLVCEPNESSISDTIIEFFDHDPKYFIDEIKREKKKLNWSSFVEKIINLKNDL